MSFNFGGRLLSLTGYLVTGLASVVATIFILANFQTSIPSPQLGTKSETTDPQPQTEQIFLNGLSLPEKESEWWAARADHRLLAQAIFTCKSVTTFPITSMPRHYYRSLLLDLTPSGDHAFAASATDAASLMFIEKSSAPLLLGNEEFKLLALSDSIARARLTAADGASVNVPLARSLGIAAIVISALATLFVTLQGRIRPVELNDGKREEFEQSSFINRGRYLLFGAGAGFRWVAFFAIALSIAGTSLAGLKQVYDPTRTLTQNTRSLLELRQLHQDVVLAANCDNNKISEPPKTAEWTAILYRLRATVLPEYGAYAALDLGGNSGPKQEAIRENPTKPDTNREVK